MRRSLWGVLAGVALSVMVGVLMSASVRAQETALPSLRLLALQLVNEERTSRQLKPLSLTHALMEAAQSHADDMLRRDYYSH